MPSQQQQQPPPSRRQLQQHESPRTHRRRSSVYDYTRQIINRGLGRPTVNTTVAATRSTERFPIPTSTSPQSVGTPSPLISVSDSKAARRRWYCCVGAWFIVTLVMNIGSTLFVVHHLKVAAARYRNSTDKYLMEHFHGQVV